MTKDNTYAGWLERVVEDKALGISFDWVYPSVLCLKYFADLGIIKDNIWLDYNMDNFEVLTHKHYKLYDLG